MKKLKLILTIGLMVFVLVGGTFFYNHLKKTIATKKVMDVVKSSEVIDFEVQTMNGEMVKLSDLDDGKPILINFWSIRCNWCVQELPTFQYLYEEYDGQIHVVMINTLSDSLATNKYVDEYRYTFPVYHDVNREARKALHPQKLPTTILLDGNHIIVRECNGPITYPMVVDALDEILK